MAPNSVLIVEIKFAAILTHRYSDSLKLGAKQIIFYFLHLLTRFYAEKVPSHIF